MCVVNYVPSGVRKPTDPTLSSSQVLLQILNFASVLTSGLMIWKGLGLITNTESPIVVVLRCVACRYPITRTAPTHFAFFFFVRAHTTFQRLHGAGILPRGPPLPRQPSKQTLRDGRHHRLQDPRPRYSDCASCSRDSRCCEDCQWVRPFLLPSVEARNAQFFLFAAFARPHLVLKTSYCSPREIITISTT